MFRGNGYAAACILFLCGLLACAVRVNTASTEAGPQTGDMGAELSYVGEAEVDSFRKGAVLFTDREYVVKEAPTRLRGIKFLRNSINRTDVRVTKGGVLWALTPDPEEPRATSCAADLEKRGFSRVREQQLFQLFGDRPWNQVHLYRARVEAGTWYRFRKWVVLLGFDEAHPQPERPWDANDGELLYNGIQLPKTWPPRDVDPADRTPMPVPYLEHPPGVIPIDVGRQLFVDDFLIAETDLVRRFHQPEKYEGNPVLQPKTPLEHGEAPGHEKPYGQGNAGAVPKSGGCWWDAEAGVFRMWYETSWFGPIAMATSRDGLHWTRPEFDVRPRTNQVSPPGRVPDSWTVVPQWNDAGDIVGYNMRLQPPGKPQPGFIFTSPDGIHWKKRGETGPAGDRTTLFYNPFREKWIHSIRSSFRGRSRDYWESDEFVEAHWRTSEPVPWVGADEKDLPDPYIRQKTQLYNLDAVAYESLMLGFFQIHRGPPNKECAEEGVPKITELNFAYSRDGFHWHRPDRRAHIPAERKPAWDRGYVQSLGNICTVIGDTLYIYYIGFRGDRGGEGAAMYNNSATGVAFLRRDGFASMEADDEAGTLTTRPVTFPDSYLLVNVDAPQGELRVAVLNRAGEPIEPFTLENCRPIAADTTLGQVEWEDGSDLSGVAGKPVRFRFQLSKGALYSFWVSPDRSGRSDGYIAGGGPGYTGPTDTVGRAALQAAGRVGKEP